MAEPIPFPSPEGQQRPAEPSKFQRLKSMLANFRKKTDKPVKMPLTEREYRALSPEKRKLVDQQRRIDAAKAEAKAQQSRAAVAAAELDKKRVIQQIPEAVGAARKTAGEVKPVTVRPIVRDITGKEVIGSSVLDKVIGTNYRSENRLGSYLDSSRRQVIQANRELFAQPAYEKGVLSYDPATRRTMVGPSEQLQRQVANQSTLSVSEATKQAHKRIGLMFGRAEDWSREKVELTPLQKKKSERRVGPPTPEQYAAEEKTRKEREKAQRDMRVQRHNNLVEQLAGKERNQARLAQNVADQMVREGLLTPEKAAQVRDNLARSPLVKRTVTDAAKKLGPYIARGGKAALTLAPKPSQPAKLPQYAVPQSPIIIDGGYDKPIGPPAYRPYTPPQKPTPVITRIGATNLPPWMKGTMAGVNYGAAPAVVIPESIDPTPRAGRRGAVGGGSVQLGIPASVPETPTGRPILNFESPPTKPTGTAGAIPPVVGGVGERINAGAGADQAKYPPRGRMGFVDINAVANAARNSTNAVQTVGNVLLRHPLVQLGMALPSIQSGANKGVETAMSGMGGFYDPEQDYMSPRNVAVGSVAAALGGANELGKSLLSITPYDYITQGAESSPNLTFLLESILPGSTAGNTKAAREEQKRRLELEKKNKKK